MTRRVIGVVAGTVALGALAVSALYATRTETPPAAPSQTAASRSPVPSATAAASSPATPPASPVPTATPRGVYLSKQLGFALTLPPPWRKADCGNTDPGTGRLPGVEQFTSAAVMDEHIGHAGNVNDRVEVRIEANAEGLTPEQFASRRFPGSPLASVTFAGRAAIEVRPPTAGLDGLFYYMADADRMYSVGHRPRTSGPADVTTMLQVLRSFRFLSTAERAALPDPTPHPAAAPTAQALAGMLKLALEQKDLAAVERLLGPCVSQAVRPGGGAQEPRERFIAELRQQFASGLTVAVDANVSTDTTGPAYQFVGSRWNAFPPGGGAPPESPRPQQLTVQLLIGQAQSGVYWSGTLVVHTFP